MLSLCPQPMLSGFGTAFSPQPVLSGCDAAFIRHKANGGAMVEGGGREGRISSCVMCALEGACGTTGSSSSSLLLQC